ncbi:glutathione S-transferase family protein [Tropicibacter alexandrii]|uniref:glutathione S-transferase family protein n=1 Tax=Tropicibacter alexandrii TaxID=2267683 RepID=UPI000EF49268|nr:glutathione S-transferase family protein [Tropicibacter alexandrii]
MDNLIFWTNPMSRGRIVRWMLEECGAQYETRVVEYGPEMKSDSYRALNPMGKVPVVQAGETVVTECAAICCWLAEAFPEAGLIPDPGARGDFYRWMFFAAGPVEAAVTAASFGFDPQDAQGARRAGWGTLASVADTLETLLADGRPWLLGDGFSAVDVYLGSQINWGQSFGTLPERAGFADYAARITTRPAAIRAKALDDALTPAP